MTPQSVGYVYTDLVSFFPEYHYDRRALEMMGFTTTEDAAQADAVVGAIAMDEDGLATVQAGAPYVGYTENAIELVQESILPALQYDYTDGKDCLGYVIYPEKTLVNASFLTGTSYVNTAE